MMSFRTHRNDVDCCPLTVQCLDCPSPGGVHEGCQLWQQVPPRGLDEHEGVAARLQGQHLRALLRIKRLRPRWRGQSQSLRCDGRQDPEVAERHDPGGGLHQDEGVRGEAAEAAHRLLELGGSWGQDA